MALGGSRTTPRAHESAPKKLNYLLNREFATEGRPRRGRPSVQGSFFITMYDDNLWSCSMFLFSPPSCEQAHPSCCDMLLQAFRPRGVLEHVPRVKPHEAVLSTCMPAIPSSNALPVPSSYRFMKRCVFARRQRTSATSPRARCLEYGLVFANFVRRQRVFGTSRRVAKMARANFCATSTRFGHLFTRFCCLFLFRFRFFR